MRLKSIILGSTSFAGLVLGASTATAQTGPALPPDPNVQAQESPADPEAGSPQTDDAVQSVSGADDVTGEEIVVTGLRRSLQTSQAIKRNSDQIVDVVVAEDIGKLPDRTVSEALARVPGVTVERQVGEAGDVFIRGLRDPATTYNGRDIFTAEARTVAPQDFPAGGVAALEVYKSLTANQVEGNLAGQINVRSRRPFDFDGLEVAGSLNGTYTNRAKDKAWNGNLLVSNRWETGIGDIGALINVSYTELEYLDSARFVSGDFFGINPAPGQPGKFCDNFSTGCFGDPPPQNVPGVTVKVPVGVGLFQSPGLRKRPSANLALQWRPTQDLHFYIDGLYQGFRREVSDRQLFAPLFGGGATYTNVALRPDQGDDFFYAASLTANGQVRPDGFQAATKEKTDTYQFAVGGSYNTDRLKLSFDIARTESQFDLSVYGVDFAFKSAPTLNVVFDVDRGDGGVEFDFGGFDTTDLNNYIFRGFFDRHLTAKGDDYQYRFDAEFKDLLSFIPTVEVGVRWVDRDGSFGNGERYQPAEALQIPYGNLPLDFRVQREGYGGGIQDVRQLHTPTYDSIRGSIVELRTLAGFAQGRPPADPRTSYTADEQAYTGYIQARYEFDPGIPIDGVIGLRAVETDFELRGNVVEEFAPGQFQLVPLRVTNGYTDYLPNASIRARLTDRLQLRAAYTETRTRPFFGQLNPGLNIDPPGGSNIRTARGGNPNLQPVQSKNYDLSLEYYFARTGFASVALFRRDVSGFIVNLTTQADIPGFGLVNIFGPANSDDGRVQGVEAQFRTFFDFGFLPEWVHGFGTELNYTYIDNELDPPGGGAGPSIAFPDVSKHTYNIVGFYERGPITARVAYNERSKYAQSFFVSGNGAFASEFVDNVSRLDASISYTLFENLTIAADASNILGKPFRNFRTIEPGIVYPRDVRYEETVYSIGIRFRL